jgi:hypothetical protein
MNQKELKNETIKNYSFLTGMYSDAYFPNVLVDKVKDILLTFCKEIEEQEPANLDELYKLSHAATDQINDLEEAFYEAGSEIETAARDTIGMDFEFIANTYNFDADVEMLIATRDW